MNMIFSIKKDKTHKVLCILGIRIKVKRQDVIVNDLKKKQALTAKQLDSTAKQLDSTSKQLDSMSKQVNCISKKLPLIEYNSNSLTRGRFFFYMNESKLSVDEKKRFLAAEFYRRVGYYPNLKHPQSINEKLNWMKLNYYNPLETKCIDKYEFKDYIKDILGSEYLIPLINVYDDMDDIDFSKLPEKFVIKTTNGYGGNTVKIVQKSTMNIDALKFEFNNMLNDWNNLYYYSMSNGYKNIKPRIIIEEYMPIREGNALEYKMFCFHGEMKFCLVECDYFGKSPKRAFYDKDFKEVPFSIGTLPKVSLSEKPAKYDEMVMLAEKLSKEIPFVRVDFYLLDDRIYIGEFTFVSGGGFSLFKPLEWDYKLGEWLDLGKLNPEYLHILPEFAEAAKEFIAPDVVDSHVRDFTKG